MLARTGYAYLKLDKRSVALVYDNKSRAAGGRLDAIRTASALWWWLWGEDDVAQHITFLIITRQCGQIRKLHLLTPGRLAAPPHISRQKVAPFPSFKTHAKASYSILDEAYNETSYWIACQ